MSNLAESTTKATATPAATGGATLTPDAGAAATTVPVGVAGGGPQSVDDFLDSMGAAGAVEALKEATEESTQRRGDTEVVSGEDGLTTETEGEGSREGAKVEGEQAEDLDQDQGLDAVEQAKAEQLKSGVLSELKKKGVGDGLCDRIAGLFVKDIKSRQALAKRDEIIGTKDSELEDLKAQLSEAASKATLGPSGPLAHLDSLEKVENVQRTVDANLEWIEERPEGWERHFPADGDEVPNGLTSEQKLAKFQREQIKLLQLLPSQLKVLTEREDARKKLKATAPTLFQAGHEDAKALREFYAEDPRTRVDADEVFRLYHKAKKMEAEEAAGLAKYHRVDLKASSSSDKTKNGAGNGNGHSNGNGNGNGHSVKQDPESGSRKSTSIILPAPKAAARIPVRSQGLSPREAVKERLEHGSVDAEEWAEAQAGN
jgi:hypothetical protein